MVREALYEQVRRQRFVVMPVYNEQEVLRKAGEHAVFLKKVLNNLLEIYTPDYLIVKMERVM